MAFRLEALLQKCASLFHIKQLQAHLITTGQFQFHPSRTKLLELCAVSPSGDLSFACNIFQQIRTPSTNDWNAIVRGLAHSSVPTQAISWFRTMLRRSQRVDALTCSFVLKACARALALSEASQMHSQTVRIGVEADVLLQTTLLDVYAKSGNRPNEAMYLFNKMKEEGWKPNEVTVLGALSACSQLSASKQGENIHR
ncbi:hypothetical protein K1719_042654 [Acacia pycnantha]|nr:hypothetical protein K1719_042654 [Acacia pycnantha]